MRDGVPTTEVIGPTTTGANDGRPSRIPALAADLQVDFVVNARDSIGPTGPRVLVEVIRTTDGAHVWTSYLEDLPKGESPAVQIARAVSDATGSY